MRRASKRLDGVRLPSSSAGIFWLEQGAPTELRTAGTLTICMLLAACIATAAPAVATPSPQRSIALTIDDLPFVGYGLDLAGISEKTTSLLAVLKARGAPVVGFVNEASLFAKAGEVDERIALLQKWLAVGAELGNHAWGHPDLTHTEPSEYRDAIVRGDVVTRWLMSQGGRTPRYFRAPLNHTGATREQRAELDGFLTERGYTLVPFTIENSDYAFARVYARALRSGDRALRDRVLQAYLEHTELMIRFCEEYALDALLSRLASRGYRFVTLQEALGDQSYATPDGYVGPRGPSWLHRWALGLGRPGRVAEEPDPPDWVLELFRAD
jgi:peptidoglycan/xylan/chitin deacetylase (PgdA/CDA1 family)